MAAPVNLLAPDGSPVNTDPEHVESLLAEGYQLAGAAPSVPTVPAVLPSSGPVNLVAPDGSAVNADAEHVESLLADGYRVASQDDMQAARDAEEYGDLGSQAAAFGESVLQGATVGAYGAVASAIDDEYDRERRLREQHNPGTALAGNVVGAVAPALLSGGTGGVGAVARVLPSAVEANLGAKLATALGSKAAAWTASRGAQLGARTVAMGLEGSADQALRTVLDDAANGDVDVTAERMVDAAWKGFATGAAFELGGSAIGAAARGVRNTARTLLRSDIPEGAVLGQFDQADAVVSPQGRSRAEVDADLQVAEQRIAEADAIGDPAGIQQAEDAANQLRMERDNAVVRESGLASDADLDLALKVETPEQAQAGWEAIRARFTKVKNARDLAQKFDDTADELTTSVTNRLDDLQRLKQNDLDKHLNRSNKPKAIRAALEQEGVVWSPQNANRVLQENEQALRAIEELRKDYALGDEVARRKLAPLKSAKEAIEGVQKHLTNIKGQGPISSTSRVLRGDLDDIAAIYWAEDNLKSYLGQIAKKKGEVTTQAEAEIQRIYMRKRAALQDAKLYGGKLAEMQTVTNAVESKAIPAGRIFHNQFGRSKSLLGEHAGEHGFDELLEMDPGKIKGFIKNLGEADSYKDEADFIRGLTRNIDLAEAKAKYYPTPADVPAKIAEARKTVNAIVEDIRQAKILKAQRDEAARLAKDHEGIDRIMMAMDALGAFLPGVHVVGKFLGSASNAIKLAADAGGRRGRSDSSAAGLLYKQSAKQRPATMLGRLADNAANTQQAVTQSADETVRGIFSPERRASLKSALVLGGNAVQRAMQQAEALQDPSSPESQSFGASVDHLAKDDPALAQALAARVRARAQFIASKMPPPLDPSDPLGLSPGRLDGATARKSQRYVVAALDPQAALKRLAAGTGTAEDLETLRALTPRLYQVYVQRVQEQAREQARRQKRVPTHRERQRLAYVTGQPFTGSDNSVGWYQSPAMKTAPVSPPSKNPNLAPAEPPQQPSQPPSSGRDTAYATRTDRVLAGV